MGLAAARAFAEAGAAVLMADFREDVVQGEAQRLLHAGHKVIGVRCDVSDDVQVEQMVSRTVSEFGNASTPPNLRRAAVLGWLKSFLTRGELDSRPPDSVVRARNRTFSRRVESGSPESGIPRQRQCFSTEL